MWHAVVRTAVWYGQLYVTPYARLHGLLYCLVHCRPYVRLDVRL